MLTEVDVIIGGALNYLEKKGISNCFLDDNSSNPTIKEIRTDSDVWMLSYLPYKERNWAGLDNEEGWGWGILNEEDGYLLDEKSYHNDTETAIDKFVEILENE